MQFYIFLYKEIYFSIQLSNYYNGFDILYLSDNNK